MNIYQETIAKTRYARYIDEQKRRESWPETVRRYISTIEEICTANGYALTSAEKEELTNAIESLHVMPSMRLLMTAGMAVKRDNICAYNCAYLAVNNKRAFSETLYVLMNGTGVGFSCERQEIAKLPEIPAILRDCEDTIVVADSKLGWAKAYKKLLSSLWEGDIPHIDYSQIRPAGARLHTFGGRASGPDPLKRLFDFTIRIFKNAAGRKLNSLEVHDIMCTIGEVVVVGGVRRSALISLSNLTDRRMRDAKSGQWWIDNGQRRLANNSVVYTEKPDAATFLDEWLSLIKSKSGERGIFNRVAAQRQASRYGLRSGGLQYGCNPCSEIILRDKQFCNLSEVVVGSESGYSEVSDRVRIATILGTIQSTLTNFQFLSAEWKANTEEERLLGVSLTGVFDNALFNNPKDTSLPERLSSLREVARVTNEEWAKKLHIKPSAAITCVKPSGTVSQLVDCASGLHPRHSQWYIRNVRMDIKDPVCAFLKNNGIPCEPDATNPHSTLVFSFPQKAPDKALTRNDVSALYQLEMWRVYQEHWCEHKPSVTVYCSDDEWPTIGAYVWEHFDDITGIAFLPKFDHVYAQAPYIDCTEEEYNKLLSVFPTTIDWSSLVEEDDSTEGAQTLACMGNVCELV